MFEAIYVTIEDAQYFIFVYIHVKKKEEYLYQYFGFFRWKKGDGLGVNKEGRTRAVKVTLKDDVKGVC